MNLDTHFLGGRYWGHWEVADIGILVVFRRKGQMLGTKIALIQSKRLYPDEIENAVDMHPMDYETGFRRLLSSDSEYKSHSPEIPSTGLLNIGMANTRRFSSTRKTMRFPFITFSTIP